MLWNWSDFPRHLSYLFRRLPNTHFSKRCCDHKLSVIWWKSFLPQKLQGQSAFASSVSNEPSGKVLGLRWVQKQNLKSVRISDLWLDFFSQSENVSSSLLSFFRLPLGPTLIKLRLSSVTYLHFFLFFRLIHLCYLQFWCEDFILRENKAPRKQKLVKWFFYCCKTVTSGRQSRLAQFLIFMTAEQGVEPESHANKSHSNPVQVTQCQLTTKDRQTGIWPKNNK